MLTINTHEYDVHIKPEKLLCKYRDYLKHLTKNYSLSDIELDQFVMNWNRKYDISQMSFRVNQFSLRNNLKKGTHSFN